MTEREIREATQLQRAANAPKHTHKFVIPVEWEYEDGYKGPDGYAPKTKIVTKLMCECGEETTRE